MSLMDFALLGQDPAQWLTQQVGGGETPLDVALQAARTSLSVTTAELLDLCEARCRLPGPNPKALASIQLEIETVQREFDELCKSQSTFQTILQTNPRLALLSKVRTRLVTCRNVLADVGRWDTRVREYERCLAHSTATRTFDYSIDTWEEFRQTYDFERTGDTPLTIPNCRPLFAAARHVVALRRSANVLSRVAEFAPRSGLAVRFEGRVMEAVRDLLTRTFSGILEIAKGAKFPANTTEEVRDACRGLFVLLDDCGKIDKTLTSMIVEAANVSLFVPLAKQISRETRNVAAEVRDLFDCLAQLFSHVSQIVGTAQSDFERFVVLKDSDQRAGEQFSICHSLFLTKLMSQGVNEISKMLISCTETFCDEICLCASEWANGLTRLSQKTKLQFLLTEHVESPSFPLDLFLRAVDEIFCAPEPDVVEGDISLSETVMRRTSYLRFVASRPFLNPMADSQIVHFGSLVALVLIRRVDTFMARQVEVVCDEILQQAKTDATSTTEVLSSLLEAIQFLESREFVEAMTLALTDVVITLWRSPSQFNLSVRSQLLSPGPFARINAGGLATTLDRMGLPTVSVEQTTTAINQSVHKLRHLAEMCASAEAERAIQKWWTGNMTVATPGAPSPEILSAAEHLLSLTSFNFQQDSLLLNVLGRVGRTALVQIEKINGHLTEEERKRLLVDLHYLCRAFFAFGVLSDTAESDKFCQDVGHVVVIRRELENAQDTKVEGTDTSEDLEFLEWENGVIGRLANAAGAKNLWQSKFCIS